MMPDRLTIRVQLRIPRTLMHAFGETPRLVECYLAQEGAWPVDLQHARWHQDHETQQWVVDGDVLIQAPEGDAA